MDPASWLQWPITVLWILAALAALLGLSQLFACRAHWRERRRVRAASRVLVLLVFAAVAALLAATGYSLRGYRWLAAETPVLELVAQRQAPQQWRLQLTFPDGRTRDVALSGDAWRVEAVVLKWKLPAVLAGVPPVYRFDRLSGRYADPAQAATHFAGVVSFENAGNLDLFRLALAHHDWLPMVDTVYGSGAYLPLADGARYRVSLMRSGALVARRVPSADGR